MASILGFLGTIVSSSVIALAVITAIFAIFKDTITSWMTKRVAVGLERAADRHRHELGRDMATYQGELNRDMEGYKNELARAQSVENFRIGVRKAVAERMLELRLTALHEVHVALSNIPSWVLANLAFNNARPSRPELQQKISEYLEPINRSGLYFPADFRFDYRQLGIEMLNLYPEWERNEIVLLDDPRTTQISTLAATLSDHVTALHRALPDELAAIIVNDQRVIDQ